MISDEILVMAGIPPHAGTCHHRERIVFKDEFFLKTICLKCKRIRLVNFEQGITCFYYFNGTRYLILNFKNGIKKPRKQKIL